MPTISYHAAVVHPDQSVTYCGTVGQDHVDAVRALAAREDVPRHVREHPRTPGAFFVLRDDGDLDAYQPVGVETFVAHAPDPGRRDEADALPRGGSGTVWIPGAVRLGDGVIGGAMDVPSAPPRCIQHTTESPAGGRYLESVGSYLIRAAAQPQLIYDPVTDRVGQFGPLNCSSRALRNGPGGYRTNRIGRVCIQIEVLGYAAHPWTDGWDPAKKPGWAKVMAAVRSWGVPDAFPAGPPPASPNGSGSRSLAVWTGEGGHYPHRNVPYQDHTDCGAVDVAKVLYRADTQPSPAPRPVPVPVDEDAFPGTAAFGPGADNAYVTRLGTMLVGRGGRRFYKVGPGPKWTEAADGAATRAFQRAQGWTGTDADGLPGPTTWRLLVTGTGKDIPPAGPVYEPFPGEGFFHTGRHSPIITAMGRRLVAEGCSVYRDGPGPDWTLVDQRSYSLWQKKFSKAHKKGWTGDAVNGIPGRETWDALKVPKV